MALITDEQKKLIYAQHGVTEDEYELSLDGDNYSLRPRFKPQVQPPEPSSSVTPLATKNIPSAAESLGRGAASSILPTAGGLLAAAGTMAVLPEPFVSKIGALGALGLAGVAGLAGSMGASKIQEAVVPDSLQQKFFTRPEDVQENPIATAAGGFIPSALAFRPSVKDLGTLASGVKNLGNVARGAEGALTAAEQAALLNATANIAPAAGMEAYDILSGNKPFNPLESAANVLPGALFTRPTALGRRLGFADPTSPEAPVIDEQTVPPQNNIPEQKPAPIASKEGVQSGIPAEGVVIRNGKAIPLGTAIKKTDLTGETRTEIVGEDQARPVKSAVASAEVIENASLAEQKRVDYETSLREKAKQDAEEVYRKAYEEAAKGKLIGSAVARPEETVKPIATTELGREILPDYTGVQEADMEANLRTPKTDAEWAQEEFDKRAKYQPAEESIDPQKLQQMEDKWKEDFEREATRRGMTVKYVDELPKGNRGMYEPSKRAVTIARKSATKDTFSHEVGHGYVEDLLATGRKGDEQQILRGLEFADPEGRKFATKADWDMLPDDQKRLIDERFVQQLGESGAKLREVELYGTKRQKFKQWLGDVGSNLKYKLGLGGAEDVSRKTAVGQRFDQPEYTARKEVKDNLTTPKMQEAADKSDYDQYQEVQAKLKEQFAKGDFSSPEFQKLWQESENIKNRNGGHVPKPPEAKTQGPLDNTDYNYYKTRLANPELLDKAIKIHYANNPNVELAVPVGGSRKSGTVGSAGLTKEEAIKVAQQLQGKEGFPDIVIKSKNIRGIDYYNVQWGKPTPKNHPFGGEEWHKLGEQFGYKKNAPKMQGASEDPEAKPFFLDSRYDKVAKLGPTGKELSENLKRFDSEASRLEGQVGNKIISHFSDYSEKEVQRVAEYRHAKSNGLDTKITLTANERALKDKLDATYKDIGKMVQDSGLLVKAGEDFRKMILKEDGYQPNVISQKVIHAWQNRTADAAKYDKLYIDYMVKKGMPEAEAKTTLQEYKQAVGNAGLTPDIEFNAIRKAEGLGLPWELVEQNPAVAARRYGRRVANDLAFFKYIQDDPRMLKALGMKSQEGKTAEELAKEKGVKLEDVEWIGNDETVKAAKRSLLGVDLSQNPVANAAIRAIGNSVMQTGTAIRNIVGLPTAVAGYYGVGPKTILEALVKMPQRAARAFENNAVRASFGDLEAGGIIEGNPNKFVQLADKYSQFMRKWTGRDFSDKFEGEFTYSLGETLAAQWFAQAKIGDIKARRMLNRFGTTVDGLKSKFLPKEKITQEDISKVAKNFVDATRGSYGPSGLPSFAIEGGAAPMVSLARWSIEKMNTFQKDIVRPITEHGDWMPLLKTSFAGLLTGAAIEQLNELLAGKRGSDATIQETFAEADIENVTAKVIGLLQLGGFGGMIGEAAKAGMATAQGKDVKFNNPVSMPATTMAETYWQQTAFALEAAQQGEDKLEVLAELMKNILKATYQNYRYADANFVSPEEAERKEKFRDMRVYSELKHEPPQARGNTNPYLGMAAREFKRADTMEEAVSSLPGAIDTAVKKSGGDYSKLKEGIEGLKRNSYQTFPKDPVQAFQYYQYLSETLGPEEARARYEDYLKQSMVNKVKNQMVPSL